MEQDGRMGTETRTGLIITIDGPSGSGKSTVAKAAAQALGYIYIDTGAMYRGVAFAYMQAGEPADMAAFLRDLPLRFEFRGGTRVFLAGADIGDEIRDPKVSLQASALSQMRAVREYLWAIQREMGKKGGIVLEGRDTGSVVFPDAQVKFFLDARPSERARRRHAELASKGVNQDRQSVESEMAARDRNDSERQLAPLVVPEGAIRVDSTGIGVDEVVEMMLGHIARVTR